MKTDSSPVPCGIRGSSELLIRELHHRVKNSFQLMLSLINLHQVHSDNDATAVLEATSHRIRALSLLHEQLFLNFTDTNVELTRYVADILTGVVAATNGNIAVHVSADCPEIFLPIETAVPVGLVITEVVTNSVKHAFDTIERPALAADTEMVGNKVTVFLCDNGVGHPATPTPDEIGFGTSVIEALSEQLRGAHSWYRPDDGGTAFRFVFPIR